MRSAAALCAAAHIGCGTALAADAIPRGFVRLAEIAPSIVQDMRYFGPWNFTGARVPGYEAGVCILARPAALALKRVQKELVPRGLSLKVYDCYRPHRATRSFLRWAARRRDKISTKSYYPRLAKRDIIPGGYVSRRSTHSRGISVDLTLVRIGDAKTRATGLLDRARKGFGPCMAAARADRFPEIALDMGTTWDCFDRKSWTASSAISPLARSNRRLLLGVMKRHGFRNYRKEWWHFTYRTKGFRQIRDFPVN